jgi:DNA-directed RNA polymerase specialized sigma24 family protein
VGDERLDAELVAELASAAPGVAVGSLVEIYRRHGDVVFGLTVRCTGDAVLAEQILHDVFVQLWDDPHSFHPAPEAPLRWQLIKAAYRRSLVKGRLRAYDGRGEQDIKGQAWRQLPPEERWAVGLARFGQMICSDIASALGLSEDTVKSQMTRGLQRLADAGGSDHG